LKTARSSSGPRDPDEASLDEPEAFRRLQKLASEKSRKLVEITQKILVAEEAVGSCAER
jgi:hypothetical protein